jgi:D-alanyl-D-alanine carboxypeptidase
MGVNQSLLEDALGYIDRWVAYRQETLGIPGVAIAIGVEDKVGLCKAYGSANLERNIPMTTEHAFRIASHSKTFTAIAIMQLVERGQLRLDDRISNHLSWLSDQEGKIGRATIRQLLSHSAGVIRDGQDASFWSFERDWPTIEELKEELQDADLVYPGSQQFKYSNIGFALLGMAIEAVTGGLYSAYVRQHILAPLNLTTTGPELDAHAERSLATGYSPEFVAVGRVPVPHVNTRALGPGAGFWSTPEDLCRFGMAHFLGNQTLLSDESKREMQRQEWVTGRPPADCGGYGLGLMIWQMSNRRMVGHTGGLNGFSTQTRIDPQDRLVVTVLVNATEQGGKSAGALNAGIVQILNRALSASTTATAISRADLDRIAGRYWGMWGAWDLVRFGDSLVGIDPEMAEPEAGLSRLQMNDSHTGTIIDADSFEAPGELARFEFAPHGVTALSWGGQRLYPRPEFQSRVLSRIQSPDLPLTP